MKPETLRELCGWSSLITVITVCCSIAVYVQLSALTLLVAGIACGAIAVISGWQYLEIGVSQQMEELVRKANSNSEQSQQEELTPPCEQCQTQIGVQRVTLDPQFHPTDNVIWLCPDCLDDMDITTSEDSTNMGNK